MSNSGPLKNFQTIYGSDSNGMVWGYHFSSNGPAVGITSEQALEWLARSPSEVNSDFLWLHFSLANSSTESWLRRHFSLPEAFYESLHSRVASTRLEAESGTLVAVIHDVQFDFSFDVSAVSTASMVVTKNLLVSARLRPLRSVDQLRSAVRSQQVFNSTGQLISHLLLDQANVLIDIVRDTTVHIDQIEDRLLASRLTSSRSELGVLRRVLVRLKRLLAPEPAALFRLLNRPPEWIAKDDVQLLRQSAEEFSVAVDDTAALVERIKLLQEEFSALINEQTNRTLYILTLVTVLALPINLVAGLFGMNVGGIPLAESTSGFFVVIAILVIVTSVSAFVYFFKKTD